MGQSRLSHPRRGDLIALRPARPGDGPATHAVFHAAVHLGAARAYSPAERAAWSPSATAPPDWEHGLLGGSTVLAQHGPRVVGFMTLGADGFLDFAYVAPDWIGRGVGRRLHGAILGIARDRALSCLDTEASLVARPFFARLGWTQAARQSVIRHGTALTNFRMNLIL